MIDWRSTTSPLDHGELGRGILAEAWWWILVLQSFTFWPAYGVWLYGEWPGALPGLIAGVGFAKVALQLGDARLPRLRHAKLLGFAAVVQLVAVWAVWWLANDLLLTTLPPPVPGQEVSWALRLVHLLLHWLLLLGLFVPVAVVPRLFARMLRVPPAW